MLTSLMLDSLQYPETPPIRYFVEKDFPCVHPRPVDAMGEPSETFAPPPGFGVRKATESES
jgi:hypothetical protein